MIVVSTLGVTSPANLILAAAVEIRAVGEVEEVVIEAEVKAKRAAFSAAVTKVALVALEAAAVKAEEAFLEVIKEAAEGEKEAAFLEAKVAFLAIKIKAVDVAKDQANDQVMEPVADREEALLNMGLESLDKPQIRFPSAQTSIKALGLGCPVCYPEEN